MQQKYRIALILILEKVLLNTKGVALKHFLKLSKHF